MTRIFIKTPSSSNYHFEKNGEVLDGVFMSDAEDLVMMITGELIRMAV